MKCPDGTGGCSLRPILLCLQGSFLEISYHRSRSEQRTEDVVHCVLDVSADCLVGVDMLTPLEGWIFFEKLCCNKALNFQLSLLCRP